MAGAHNIGHTYCFLKHVAHNTHIVYIGGPASSGTDFSWPAEKQTRTWPQNNVPRRAGHLYYSAQITSQSHLVRQGLERSCELLGVAAAP